MLFQSQSCQFVLRLHCLPAMLHGHIVGLLACLYVNVLTLYVNALYVPFTVLSKNVTNFTIYI